MAKLRKITVLAVPILGIGMWMAYREYMFPIVFSATGKVSSLNWNSEDHGMPIIEIVDTNGNNYQFKSYRIIHKFTEIKVGDSFKKNSGTNKCDINDVLFQCVN